MFTTKELVNVLKWSSTLFADWLNMKRNSAKWLTIFREWYYGPINIIKLDPFVLIVRQ